MLFTGTNISSRFYQPQDHIHIFQCLFCHIYHIFAQFVLGFVDPRCIQKDDLSVFTGIHGLDFISGGLWFFGCDSNLLSDQMVHQSGFPHVRSSDDCHESGFKIFLHMFSFIVPEVRSVLRFHGFSPVQIHFQRHRCSSVSTLLLPDHPVPEYLPAVR